MSCGLRPAVARKDLTCACQGLSPAALRTPFCHWNCMWNADIWKGTEFSPTERKFHYFPEERAATVDPAPSSSTWRLFPVGPAQGVPSSPTCVCDIPCLYTLAFIQRSFSSKLRGLAKKEPPLETLTPGPSGRFSVRHTGNSEAHYCLLAPACGGDTLRAPCPSVRGLASDGH